ncbi:hypothetical protein [Roseibium polysiphoniae]|uniref:Uncharacterized protein n=1 Tax=Roseibium polysiphoniae TaxID=2571221 RepID=A0ABR9C5L6_9HYPH|nr:hypothetical protein [Roseibium polysiphoniae]MBD8875140.1 hypothetical protein [Roseibium polysiphoniae]
MAEFLSQANEQDFPLQKKNINIYNYSGEDHLTNTNNYAAYLQEFSKILGISIHYNVISEPKYSIFPYINLEKALIQGTLLDAIRHLVNQMSFVYANIIQDILNDKTTAENGSSKSYFKIKYPSIEPTGLRNFVASHHDPEEIAGTFLGDLKADFPEFIASIQAPERRIIEQAISEYGDWLSEKSKKKLDDATKVLSKAQQRTEEAHRKTDEALSAEEAGETAEGLERLTAHWKDKAQHHQVRRSSNIILFVSILAVSLLVLMLSQAGILQASIVRLCGDSAFCPTPWQRFLHDAALAAKTNGSWIFAILSLKGVLIPILGVTWLLRILSRQNNAHFALENDARQRLALLFSFVRLQELPEVKLTDDERLLILQQLFKPADSPAKDDGPPTATELLSKFKT